MMEEKRARPLSSSRPLSSLAANDGKSARFEETETGKIAGSLTDLVGRKASVTAEALTDRQADTIYQGSELAPHTC